MRTVLVLAVLTATATHAQDTPARNAAPARVGLFDIERAGSQSLAGRSIAGRVQALKNEIDAERARKQAALDKMEGEIKALQDELDKQAAFLSEDAAESKRQEIKRKTRDRQAFIDDGSAEIERLRQRAQTQGEAWSAELRAKIQPHAEAAARHRGLDILLDARGAMAIGDAFDVTSDVIVRMDEAERASAAKPGAK
jgi:Skp family chaperone for outer membrane proteins